MIAVAVVTMAIVAMAVCAAVLACVVVAVCVLLWRARTTGGAIERINRRRRRKPNIALAKDMIARGATRPLDAA